MRNSERGSWAKFGVVTANLAQLEEKTHLERGAYQICGRLASLNFAAYGSTW